MPVEQLAIENIVDSGDVVGRAQHRKRKIPGEVANVAIVRIIHVYGDQLQTFRCPISVGFLQRSQLFPRIRRLRGPEVQKRRFAAEFCQRKRFSRQIGKRKVRSGYGVEKPGFNPRLKVFDLRIGIRKRRTAIYRVSFERLDARRF